LILGALALAAGCSREIPVHPWNLQVTDGAGRSMVDAVSVQQIVTFTGTAHVASPTRLDVVSGGSVDTSIQFDNRAAPQVVFPPVLEGAVVDVWFNANPSGAGPAGPVRIPSLRLWVGGRVRFLLGEDSLRRDDGTPAFYRPLLALDPDEGLDLPLLDVKAPGIYFEPSRCGDAYYDVLRVAGSTKNVYLDFGHQTDVPVANQGDLPTWQVVHVASWHRAGVNLPTGGGSSAPKDCKAEDMAWTQVAAWR
jgi:hypothetical protein